MNKQRDLPVFNLEGTDFLVDVDKQVLRQKDNPANEISFVQDMADHITHYWMEYDTVEKTHAKSPFLDSVKDVEIPLLKVLDPEGMSERYGVPVNEMANKTDLEIIVDQELLQVRRQGILPQIDIAGEKFVVDAGMEELRHAANFHPVFNFQSFDLSEDGHAYTAFYAPLIKQLVQIDPKLLEFPEGIVQIKFPTEIYLDPVGTAQANDLDEAHVLRRVPLQKEYKAEVIPLSETNIPALIQKNKQQLQQEHAEKMKQSKPRQRPRF